MDDYLPCHGHPHSNGQGHVLTKIDGKQFVKIPSPRVWKLKKRRRQEVEIKECSSVSNRCSLCFEYVVDDDGMVVMVYLCCSWTNVH